MPKLGRLRSAAQFARVREHGRRVSGKLFALSHAAQAPQASGVTQVGFITTKKLGNAVARNRARRIMRAAVAALSARLRPGFDLVLVGYSGLAQAGIKTQDVLKELTWLAQRANLLNDAAAPQA